MNDDHLADRHSEARTMTQLGINTCFAVKRWPRPADWAPIVRDECGLDLVQVSLDLVDVTRDADSMARDVDEHLEAAARYGIRLHSAFTGVAGYSSNLLLHPSERERDAAERWYERAIDFAARVGAASMGGHVGAFSVPDWADPARRGQLWEELRVRLGRLAGVARRRGLEGLLVENLAARREPSTMTDIESLITAGDSERVPIQLCLDVGHMCVPDTQGEERDPYAWLRRMGGRASVIQIQQGDTEGDRHWPFTARYADVGRIDPDRVLEALGRDVKAPLVLEVIPAFEAPDADVLADLVESARCWREAIARSEYPVV
jgi:sugar phosphate isomerase/epimerase